MPTATQGRAPGKTIFEQRIDPLDNWTWGLSLIALTIAIHGTGVMFMALAGVSLRHQVEIQNDRPNRRDGTISRYTTRDRGRPLGGGILVAWRTQLAGRCDPLLSRLDQHPRCCGANARGPLADNGRAGGDGRHATVRYQH